MGVFGKKIKTIYLAQLLDGVSFMLEVGITPLDGITRLIEYGHVQIKPIARKIQHELYNGCSLAEAFLKNEDVLGKGLYSPTLYAMESGNLPETLKRLSEQMINKNQNAKKIQNALIYPCVVLLGTFIAAWYLFTNVVPQFGEVIAEMSGGSLPLLTLWVMGLSEILVKHGIWIALVLILCVAILLWLIKNPFALPFAHFILRVPVVGRIINNNEYIVVYRCLCDMLNAGATLGEAFVSLEGLIKNDFIRKEFARGYKRLIADGLRFGEVLAGMQSVDALDLQAISIGEDTGKVPEILFKIYKRKETENEELIKVLLSLTEPFLMVLVGGIVSIIVFAIYIPMLSMASF